VNLLKNRLIVTCCGNVSSLVSTPSTYNISQSNVMKLTLFDLFISNLPGIISSRIKQYFQVTQISQPEMSI